MTDDITEAVRRLRSVQMQVERLKGGDKGNVRNLRAVDDVLAADDDVAVSELTTIDTIAEYDTTNYDDGSQYG